MSSFEFLRELINQRLTAAAEEIFRGFMKTIVEYEEEIYRQSRLLDILWKPDVKLQRIELTQQHVCQEEEVLTDQERTSNLDQEDPDPPQIKEEQEELDVSQEGEQIERKQEADTFMFTLSYEDSDHSEPEPNSDQQLLFDNSHVAESQDQKRIKQRHHKSRSHSNEKYTPTIAEVDCDIQTGKLSLKCDTCGQDFLSQSSLQRHLKSHTGEKLYLCKTCGKTFGYLSVLKNHTGEKPYFCDTCGKKFRQPSILKAHARIHTGEKSNTCETCGEDFSRNSSLLVHLRTHTDEKPYLCRICGKRYSNASYLAKHIRGHEGQ